MNKLFLLGLIALLLLSGCLGGLEEAKKKNQERKNYLDAWELQDEVICFMDYFCEEEGFNDWKFEEPNPFHAGMLYPLGSIETYSFYCRHEIEIVYDTEYWENSVKVKADPRIVSDLSRKLYTIDFEVRRDWCEK